MKKDTIARRVVMLQKWGQEKLRNIEFLTRERSLFTEKWRGDRNTTEPAGITLDV